MRVLHPFPDVCVVECGDVTFVGTALRVTILPGVDREAMVAGTHEAHFPIVNADEIRALQEAVEELQGLEPDASLDPSGGMVRGLHWELQNGGWIRRPGYWWSADGEPFRTSWVSLPEASVMKQVWTELQRGLGVSWRNEGGGVPTPSQTMPYRAGLQSLSNGIVPILGVTDADLVERGSGGLWIRTRR